MAKEQNYAIAIRQKVADYEKSVTETIEKTKARLIAKRDFVIHQNEHHIEIKAGDDLSSVPKMFLENLKTENVI
jgi:hypothetical protein